MENDGRLKRLQLCMFDYSFYSLNLPLVAKRLILSPSNFRFFTIFEHLLHQINVTDILMRPDVL